MPLANYLICTHPRSGSNFLCELLASTGKMGEPAEYFHEANMQRSGLSVRNKDDIVARFDFVKRQKSSANGVFGIKLFFFDLESLRGSRIFNHFGNFQFIFLERRDKLLQAISIRKALHSGQLRSDTEAARPQAEYDYEDIRLRLLRSLRADQNWLSFFRLNGIDPVICIYEQLALEPESNVDRIAKAIGLETPVRIDTTRLRLRVQRDSSSLAWRDRFLAEAAVNDPRLHQFCIERLSAVS